ncbi:MAG: TetR family transcriptional regulator C-terminal domain-containing protein [Sphingomonadaceae bacterium]
MSKPNVRDQLITASLATLHSKGFNATSVQDITDAAGVPKGSFYNHFASKEVLGAEVVQHYAEASRRLHGPLTDASLAPLARLAQYFDGMVQANVDNQFHSGCLLGNFSTELSAQSPLIRAQVERAFQQWSDGLAAVISLAQQEGSVASTDSAAALADAVLQAWQGAVARARTAHSRAPLDLFRHTTLRKLLQ